MKGQGASAWKTFKFDADIKQPFVWRVTEGPWAYRVFLATVKCMQGAIEMLSVTPSTGLQREDRRSALRSTEPGLCQRDENLELWMYGERGVHVVGNGRGTGRRVGLILQR